MRRIIKCSIGPIPLPGRFPDEMPSVTVTFNDDSTKRLFEYYPDEISFCEQELLGLTEEEAFELKKRKDAAFLQGAPRPRGYGHYNS